MIFDERDNRIYEGVTREINFSLNFPQAEFLSAPESYCLLSMGYGGGKSFALREKCILRSAQNVGLSGMFVASDFGRLSRDVVPQLFESLERHEISHEWVKQKIQGVPARAILIGKGWLDFTLFFASADDPNSLKGPNHAAIFLEEATLLPKLIPGKQETLWSVLVSRLRVPGGTMTIDASGTPEGLANWTYAPGMFERAPDEPARLDWWRKNFRVIRGTSFDNAHNLAAGAVDQMVQSMDPAQVQEKIYGIPAAGVGGQAYRSFDPKRNIRTCNYDRLKGSVIVGFDFGISPAAAVIGQFFRGHLGWFDEVRLTDADTFKSSAAVVSKLRAIGVRPQDAIIYPDATGKRRQTVGESDHNVLRESGLINIRAGPTNPRVSDRLNSANGALYHGRMYADPRCKWLIRDWSLVTIDDYGDIRKNDQSLTHNSDSADYPCHILMPVRRRTGVGYT